MRALTREEIDLVAGGADDDTTVSTITITASEDPDDEPPPGDDNDPEDDGEEDDDGGGDSDGDGPAEVTTGPIGSDADIHVKPGADIANLSPEMKATFEAIVAAWAGTGLTPVITSGDDSTHMEGSLHYEDQAIDLRANNITDAEAEAIADALQAALGDDYFVDFEKSSTNAANDHIHVEYDPD